MVTFLLFFVVGSMLGVLALRLMHLWEARAKGVRHTPRHHS